MRFVQLYHTDWDHHGGPGQTLDPRPRPGLPRDRPAVRGPDPGPEAARAARDTLVVWGGEFGRTPMGEIRETVGRNHHIDAMTMWLAGGGVKPGLTLGATDEFGFAPSPTASTFTTCRRRSCTCWASTTPS